MTLRIGMESTYAFRVSTGESAQGGLKDFDELKSEHIPRNALRKASFFLREIFELIIAFMIYRLH
jgi:hypothetical protein